MYLIDSNVLIQAHRRHYGFDFVPAFWDWIDSSHSDGRVLSVAEIYDEVMAGKDELAEWVKKRGDYYLEPDEKVVDSLRKIAVWAQAREGNGASTAAAVAEFLAAGDSYLVAHAHAYSFTVVTHEVSEPDRKNRIKIPDACSAFGVTCVGPFEMLATEKARFVLDP